MKHIFILYGVGVFWLLNCCTLSLKDFEFKVFCLEFSMVNKTKSVKEMLHEECDVDSLVEYQLFWMI